jgi:hypothetical protein
MENNTNENFIREYDEKEKTISTEIDPTKKKELEKEVEIIAGKLRERNINAFEIEAFNVRLLEMAIKIERMHNSIEKLVFVNGDPIVTDGQEFLGRILNSNSLRDSVHRWRLGKKNNVNEIILKKLLTSAENEFEANLRRFRTKLINRKVQTEKHPN